MKYNKNLPLYYIATPCAEDGTPLPVNPAKKTALFSCKSYAIEHGAEYVKIESMQKINGNWEAVTGRAKVVVNGIIKI